MWKKLVKKGMTVLSQFYLLQENLGEQGGTRRRPRVKGKYNRSFLFNPLEFNMRKKRKLEKGSDRSVITGGESNSRGGRGGPTGLPQD